ncbi:DUF72 domain-containing protein [Jiella sp. M17.18]|uniref:DUF72 domain-containing protein n=1 Tax=Jiella sp. M17.18 TaxID=3234247 RepID=UPI0034DEC5C3
MATSRTSATASAAGPSSPGDKTFYPSDLSKKRQLEYVAFKLTTIEVNRTFHQAQNSETFASWGEQTPDVTGPLIVTERRDSPLAPDFRSRAESASRYDECC